MIKVINRYITAFDYAGKNLLVLGASCGVSICLFVTVIGAPVGIQSAGNDLVLLFSNRIHETFLKTMGRKKQGQKSYFIG